MWSFVFAFFVFLFSNFGFWFLCRLVGVPSFVRQISSAATERCDRSKNKTGPGLLLQDDPGDTSMTPGGHDSHLKCPRIDIPSQEMSPKRNSVPF